METRTFHNKISKSFNLLMAVITGLATTQTMFAITRGPNSAGNLSNVALAGFSTSWINLNNGLTSDNSYVGIPLNGLSNSGQYTDYLFATNFDASVPAGSTIDGILVEVERSDMNNAKDFEVKIFNMAGEIVSDTGFEPEIIDISEMPSGIYFAQVNSESGTVTKKIIKRE